MDYTVGAHHYVVSNAALSLFIVLAAWELVWKGFALWRAGQNRQLAWFIVMLVLNTVGILEIIYLFFVAKKDKPQSK